MRLKKEVAARVARLQKRLESSKVDAHYVSNTSDVRYLSGKDAGRALVTRDSAVLWVRDIYLEVYEGMYSGSYAFDVRSYTEGSISEYCESLGIQRVSIEDVPATALKVLRKRFRRVDVNPILEGLRAVKSGFEIELLKESAGLTSRAMEYAGNIVGEGLTEMAAVAEIEYYLRKHGSEKPSFGHGMLLASGAKGADIHASATVDKIEGGVVVDLGACIGGYFTDMTRTFDVGGGAGGLGGVMDFVKSMQDAAFDMVEAGLEACELHEYIESLMRDAGYTLHHSLGHGVGLDIHESPHLGPASKDVLVEGMVFTLEPGVYIPRKYGVRFEDTVLLTKKGAVKLTE